MKTDTDLAAAHTTVSPPAKAGDTGIVAVHKTASSPTKVGCTDIVKELKLFGVWSTNVTVNDVSLKPYVNFDSAYVPFSAGRTAKRQFYKSKKNIIERLMDKLMVTGHKGKKHFRTSGLHVGKIALQFKNVKRTFEIVEQKTKKNPVEVLVRAIENGAPKEGVATIEYGGMRYPKAADLAPQRRIDMALRWMTQGAFWKTFKGREHIWKSLADEIIATANNDPSKSNCLTKKIELEKQAAGSR